MSDQPFPVGPDLVQFDRRDLPIYETPETRWAQACDGPAAYGAPLDRLFGEAGEVHIVGAIGSHGEPAALPDMAGEDPLVLLAALSDGVTLPDAPGPGLFPDSGAEDHPAVPLHDGSMFDVPGADWTFDFYT